LAGSLDRTFCGAIDRGDEVEKYLSAKKRAHFAELLRAIGAFNQRPGINELRAVDFVLKHSTVTLFRREAWDETIRAIIAAKQSDEEPGAVFEALRSWTKYTNSRFGGNTVSRTLLVKGLEFSNVLVAHAGEKDARGNLSYSKENLYVALTRAIDILWIQR
jgi:superfamily I DNA/RNA helicase